MLWILFPFSSPLLLIFMSFIWCTWLRVKLLFFTEFSVLGIESHTCSATALLLNYHSLCCLLTVALWGKDISVFLSLCITHNVLAVTPSFSSLGLIVYPYISLDLLVKSSCKINHMIAYHLFYSDQRQLLNKCKSSPMFLFSVFYIGFI